MLIYFVLPFAMLMIFFWHFLIRKNIDIWLLSYIKQGMEGKIKRYKSEPLNVVFCCVDHFEPAWNNAGYNDEIKRIDTWMEEYPKMADKHFDCNGRHPQHTFFYPVEEYRKEHLDKLVRLVKDGYGDVEIHLHHDKDTVEGLTEKLLSFKKILRGHGLLGQNDKGDITYGFIHGDWALDNSRKDGKMCGVNNELQVLRSTGCYADFTMPSAPSETQTRKINSIYYAVGDPSRPKSHDTGIDVEVGRAPEGDLMLIQGPLTLNWINRKWSVLPRIENGELTVENPPTNDRVDLWVRQHIHVKGEPNWIFIKVHTHGCQEKHKEVLLGKYADDMHDYLEKKYNDGVNYKLHYVTARGMYETIKGIEGGAYKM